MKQRSKSILQWNLTHPLRRGHCMQSLYEGQFDIYNIPRQTIILKYIAILDTTADPNVSGR